MFVACNVLWVFFNNVVVFVSPAQGFMWKHKELWENYFKKTKKKKKKINKFVNRTRKLGEFDLLNVKVCGTFTFGCHGNSRVCCS